MFVHECVCLYAHLVLTPSVITNQQRSFIAYPVTSLLNHMSDWPWSPGAVQSLAQLTYSQLTSHTHPSEKWSAYSVITHCRLRIDFTHSSVPYSLNPKRKGNFLLVSQRRTWLTHPCIQNELRQHVLPSPVRDASALLLFKNSHASSLIWEQYITKTFSPSLMHV